MSVCRMSVFISLNKYCRVRRGDHPSLMFNFACLIPVKEVLKELSETRRRRSVISD